MKLLRVVYPWTLQRPEALAALAEHRVERFYVGGHDDAYWRLLAWLWGRGGCLLIVEQDVVVGEGCLDVLEACEWPWCCAAIPRHNPPHELLTHSLGCVRFSAEMVQAEPDAMAEAARFTNGLPPGHWCHLDVAVYETLTRRGYVPHVHYGPVIHLPKPACY